MKKFLVSILTLLYITSSTGANLHMHYCMGKLADWSLQENTSGNCDNCGMKKMHGKDNGCCEDKQQYVKINADQKLTHYYPQQVPDFTSPAAVDLIEIPNNTFLSPIYETLLGNAMLRPGDIAIYKRNCVFRL